MSIFDTPLQKSEKEEQESYLIPTPSAMIDKQKSPTQDSQSIFSQSLNKAQTPQPESSKKLSQTELYKLPEFQELWQSFLNSNALDEDFFEYMRDAEYSVGGAALRAYQAGKWDNKQKQQYLKLQEYFDNTELKGTKEWFQFMRNIGSDLITDPANAAALLFAIPSWGGSMALRAAAGKASQQAIKKYTVSRLAEAPVPTVFKKKAIKDISTRAGLYGAAEGAVWGGAFDYFDQSKNVNLDLQDDINWTQLGLVAGVGGTIGGALGVGIGRLSGPKVAKEEFNHANEQAILKAAENKKKLGKQDADLDDVIDSRLPSFKRTEQFIAATTGKATTALLSPAKSSPTLQEFLAKIRYDWDFTLLGEKTKGEKAASFGNSLGRRQGWYLFRLEKALNDMGRESNWLRLKFGELTEKDNKQLITLLRSPARKKIDGELVDPEIRKVAAQIRSILKDIFKEGKDEKLFKSFQQVINYVPRRFNYALVEKNKKLLEELIIKHGLADPLTEYKKTKAVLETGKEVDVVLKEQGMIDQEYFGKDVADVWIDAWKKGDKDTARKLKANTIVENMLEDRWTPFELRGRGDGGPSYGFLKHRPFHAIPDEELAPFLENNIEQVLQDYIVNASQAITRTKFFGRTSTEFKKNYLEPIREELLAKKMPTDEVGKVVDGVWNMHNKVTGIDAQVIKNNILRNTSDWGKLSQQMAHLPLATLSSITEPLILLSRVGIEDTPYVVKDIGKALLKETSKTIDRTIKGIRRGVLGQKVKGKGKDLNDEEWMELYQTGLALEQAVMERIEGMFGEAFQNKTAKTFQNMFFKSNILTQWTSAVQLASFTTGKRLIRSNAKKLYENREGTKFLSRKKQRYYEEQLEDLGLNINETLTWYKSSLKNGKVDNTLATKNKFYKNNIMSAANRFTKEIILNPSTAEANRPMWFSDPSVNYLVQFAGYPTVFNNTILKRFVNESKNYPLIAGPKVLATTLLMTSVALLGNYVRTVGIQRNEERWKDMSIGELISESIRRWGGFGPFDYVARWADQEDRGLGIVPRISKSVVGPLPQDIMDMFLYRKGIAETALSNVPYSALLPTERKKELKKLGREIDDTIEGVEKKKTKKYRSIFDKGGLVENVANASAEPEENKVRGQPFTYAELGGVLAQDVEDRRGFAIGGNVKSDEVEGDKSIHPFAKELEKLGIKPQELPKSLKANIWKILDKVKENGYRTKEEHDLITSWLLPSYPIDSPRKLRQFDLPFSPYTKDYYSSVYNHIKDEYNYLVEDKENIPKIDNMISTLRKDFKSIPQNTRTEQDMFNEFKTDLLSQIHKIYKRENKLPETYDEFIKNPIRTELTLATGGRVGFAIGGDYWSDRQGTGIITSFRNIGRGLFKIFQNIRNGYRWFDTAPFIDRIENPKEYRSLLNPDGTRSTYKMSAEVDEHNPNLWYVFPTMIPPKRITEGNTKNEWLQFDDNRQALEHNIKFGNIKIFSNKEDAITYAEGGYKEDTELENQMDRLGLAEGGEASREEKEKEYKQKRQELEDYISKNILVSKEAQMSLLSGEGYRDPRFIATTGNELIDKYGLHPLAAEGSGQVLYDKQLGLQVSSNKNASVIDIDTGVSAETLGIYNPSSDQLKYQSMTYDLGRTDRTPEETQVHEIIHRADERSGYKEHREKRLKANLPKELKVYGHNRFSPLTKEILAYGLQHKLAGGNFNDKELTDQVKFRIRRYARNFKNPKKIEEELLQAMPTIVEDFESYLQELEE